ncbi:MAG TPA: HD-GYP domain-containing protein [Dehalococcoidia bacterium]|nr:HD-GYP domain-containing protein [Dehalococcoidia bacterium]
MGDLGFRRVGIAACLAALASPILFLAVARAFPAIDGLQMHFHFHFWIVGVTALASAVACGVVIAGAKTLRETRLLFLALAFLSIAAVFSVHGLLTPGVIKHEFYMALGVSAWVSVMLGSVLVALSAVELPAGVDGFVRKRGGMIFAWFAIGLATYILVSWNIEGWLNDVPTDDRTVQYGIALTSTALFGFALYRYAQAWFFARLPSQAVMAAALALLVQVPPILLWGQVWHLSWWVYHFAYGAAFVVLFAGWGLEWRRAGSLSAIAEALSMRDALAQLNRGRDRQVVELVDAIEAKDRYTVGHVHRVGSLAFEIGKQLGLSAAELREVVLAAQMHDVGKIGTPTAILQKPGALTGDEMTEMRRHTVFGSEIAGRVRALRTVSPAVRAHHERFDGGGYPDGLRGETIPFAARVVSVADTYDAMTTARPYREAQSHEAAIAEIRRVRGTQLDPRCVDAFLALFEAAAAA